MNGIWTRKVTLGLLAGFVAGTSYPAASVAQQDMPPRSNEEGPPSEEEKAELEQRLPRLRPLGPGTPGVPMRTGVPGPGVVRLSDPQGDKPEARADMDDGSVESGDRSGPVGPGPVGPGPAARTPGDEAQVVSGTGLGEGRQKPPVMDPNAKVTIDFVDAEVMDVIRYMAEITGRNFILGDKLSGKITIISNKPVTVAEAYEAFLSALEVTGYTTVTIGKATKVVKSGEAAKVPLRVYDGEVPYTDNFVTQILQLDNVLVKDISSVVKELSSSAGRVIAYSPTNTLILTDSATNLRRIQHIINVLDVAAPKSTLRIFPLRYATASDLAEIVKEIYGVEDTSGSSTSAGTDAASRARRTSRTRREREPAEDTSATQVGEGTYISKILPDERTNSIIVQANEEAMVSIADLIAKLDVDVDPASRAQIHVVYLEHAKAEDVAQVLANLAGTSRTGTRTGTTGRTTQTQRQGRMPPGQVGPMDMAADAAKEGGAVAAFESGLKVASDENTNSLVIISGPEEFRIVKQVIDKLDIRRKQVFVEVVLLEMASDDTFDWGIGYHAGSTSEEGSYGAISTQLNAYSLGLSASDLLSGMAMGVFGKSIEVAVTGDSGSTTTMSVPAFGVALNALQSNSAVNIVATPNVLTMDNEEAKFIVGRNIPFPISTGRDSNNNPIISYQREDVANTLKVTPQINESNFVTLEVFQEVQEIEEDSQGLDINSAGFITSKRSAETTVVVQDNQTVVIGGLISTTETEVETKIPVLGDLPLVGAIFRGTRKQSRKTNLLIFLTPHVIGEPEDLEEVYRVKVAQRNEFIRRFYGKSREQQEEELEDLLQGSMNLVDEPSLYRTKIASETHATIGGSGDTPVPVGEASVDSPAEETDEAPAAEGEATPDAPAAEEP
ncbi:MAG: type II secretion system secretin GspD [Deltaproteobacteria bacterium]|nr:type II secretion system secretin GspD [Deltaproteobacteria bacterium]